ncbi:MAG: serine/threonine protein kinase [Anaerolineales bacterium]
MNQILKPKQTVHLESSGALCKVEKFLGGGGQGEVYRADLKGKAVALKWYFPAQATPAQRQALQILVKKGPPNDRFLWPSDMASEKDVPGFGYVMPLREPRYKSIIDLMKRRAEPTFRALATAGFQLADSYFQLHAMGFCYRDISFGNVFFDPDSGQVLVCDNDNVTIDGAEGGGVIGTPRFMAPEIVRGEARPDMETDLFSLAVLLFYMFMVHHPLEGNLEAQIRCFDLPAMTKLYGTHPVFIFDPEDDSNRPVPGLHDNALAFWPLYPQFLRAHFTRSFTAGIRDPLNGRVRESEWRAAMIRLRDSIVYCSSCGSENFYDADALQASGGVPGHCWACSQQLQMPPRIRIGRSVVMLNHDTHLFPHHVDVQKPYDFSQPVAEVVQHPRDPGIWGLKNLANEKWVITTADGGIKDVPPGRSVTLVSGTKIQFGRADGRIRVGG